MANNSPDGTGVPLPLIGHWSGAPGMNVRLLGVVAVQRYLSLFAWGIQIPTRKPRKTRHAARIIERIPPERIATKFFSRPSFGPPLQKVHKSAVSP
jgi:hypothetical protein